MASGYLLFFFFTKTESGEDVPDQLRRDPERKMKHFMEFYPR